MHIVFVSVSWLHVNGQEAVHNKSNKELTVINPVNKIVYDTIYEYEIIYDTVWVFDTILIDTTLPKLSHLPALPVTELYFTPEFYKQIILPEWYKKQKSTEQTERPETGDSKSQFRKKSLKRKWFNYSPQPLKMTLNPTYGKFNPQLFKQGNFTLNATRGIEQSKTYPDLKFNRDEFPFLAGTFKDERGTNIGINLEYYITPYSLKTGISLLNLNETYSFIQTQFELDSSQMSELTSKWETRSEEVKILDLDKLLQGDSVWITYTYTYDTLIYYDSTFYLYDTTIITTPSQNSITHQFIEVPVILSYRLFFSRTSVNFYIGLINQFHLRTKGQVMNRDGKLLGINSLFTYKKYNAALFVGLGLEFRISQSLGFEFGGYYKFPLMNFGNASGTRFWKQTYGLNAGISYYF